MKFVVIDRPKFWGFVLRKMFGIKKQPAAGSRSLVETV